MLSLTQQQSALEYHQNKSLQIRNDMTLEISRQMEVLSLRKRKVTHVLKLLVVDASLTAGDKPHSFNIWNPTDDHIQMMRENALFTVYNVIPGYVE